MGGGPQAHRERLWHALKRQTIVVPSVTSVFGSWSTHRNRHYKALKKAVDQRLEALSFDAKKIAKLKAADFALFACLWWPEADYDDLYITICLVIWLFMWDDELDEPNGSLTNDMDRASQYRRLTMRFVEQSLGLHEHGLVPDALSPLISGFELVGQDLKQRYSLSQRHNMRDEIEIFVKSTKVEQSARLNDVVWNMQDYFVNRAGTSAVGVTSSMIELVNHTQLPDHVMHSEDMKIVWHETNMIISIANDLLSAKKELAHGCVGSFLPVFCHSGSTAQEAVDQAVSDLRERVRNFDDGARRLLEQHPKHQDPETHEAIRRFIRASQENCTGNMVWSLITPRYGLTDCPRTPDGSVRIRL